MANIKLIKELTIEKLNELVSSQLNDSFQFKIKNNRLRIEENRFRGCNVTLKKKNGLNQCYIFGFMPSIVVRLALLLGILAVFSIITSLMIGEFNLITGGLIPFIIYFIVIDIPSQKLVNRISQIVKEYDSDQNKISNASVQTSSIKDQPSTRKSWILIAVLILVSIIAVVVLKPKKQFQFPINQTTDLPIESELKENIEPKQIKVDGKIIAKTQMLKDGDTIDLDYQISVKVKSNYIQYILEGQEVRVTISDYPDLIFITTIEKIRPVVTSEFREMELILPIPIRDSRLKKGTIVTVNIKNQNIPD